MSRRVRSLAAAILALSLVFSVPTASAAMERERGMGPGFFQRVVRTIKKVLKPLAPIAQEEGDSKPTPPIP